MLNAILIVSFWLVIIVLSILVQNYLISKVLNFGGFYKSIYYCDATKIHRKAFYSVAVIVTAATCALFTLINGAIAGEVTGFMFMYFLIWIPKVFMYNNDTLENRFNKPVRLGTHTVYVHRDTTDEMVERIKNGEDVGKFRQLAED